jgi:ribose transport system permease protein
MPVPGWSGSLINSFIGVLIILTLDAGLAQTGTREFAKHLITGVVIIIAVSLDALRMSLLPGLQNRFFSRTSSRP